jgi:hypothetical protein
MDLIDLAQDWDMCEYGNEIRVPKMQENFWLAANLLASEEGLCSVE